MSEIVDAFFEGLDLAENHRQHVAPRHWCGNIAAVLAALHVAWLVVCPIAADGTNRSSSPE